MTFKTYARFSPTYLRKAAGSLGVLNMTIPDDMVEKAAMAFFAAVYDEQLFVWVEEAEATKAAMRDGARAALEAVAPALIAQAEHAPLRRIRPAHWRSDIRNTPLK